MVSAYPIALEVSSTHTSPLSTPSVSPANSLKVEDRVHALLSAADSGTHEFSHGDWPDFSLKQLAAPIKQRTPLLSMLSLTRPSASISLSTAHASSSLSTSPTSKTMRHFDPSRDPKLHGLL